MEMPSDARSSTVSNVKTYIEAIGVIGLKMYSSLLDPKPTASMLNLRPDRARRRARSWTG